LFFLNERDIFKKEKREITSIKVAYFYELWYSLTMLNSSFDIFTASNGWSFLVLYAGE